MTTRRSFLAAGTTAAATLGAAVLSPDAIDAAVAEGRRRVALYHERLAHWTAVVAVYEDADRRAVSPAVWRPLEDAVNDAAGAVCASREALARWVLLTAGKSDRPSARLKGDMPEDEPTGVVLDGTLWLVARGDDYPSELWLTSTSAKGVVKLT